ncbi:methyltransferase domain-containing protein [Actinomadura welshii]|uniref:methyltransferase domain-containing protein n=1 Tax=Actinomadura welshii TaxID=3103817 RepID=UPI0003ACE60C|nr:methyltransferase domain-containing protein [Actinomadura madurae]
MSDLRKAASGTPAPDVDDLVRAVLDVWSAVVDPGAVHADVTMVQVGLTVDDAVEIVSLLNQWLGSNLTVELLFALRTPRRIAEVLRSRGVVPPPGGRPAPTAAASDGTGAESAQGWQGYWETTYRFSGANAEDGFNTAGWFNHDTPTSIPPQHMREWVDTTVRRLDALSPRRVLDIGCGAGLIMSRLAARRDRYLGLDFSLEAIERARRLTSADPALAAVELLHADARSAGRITGPFDLVLLNSVIQYLPSVEHLYEVIGSATRALAPDGAFFLGDIVNRDLSRTCQVMKLATGGPAETTAGEFRRSVRAAMARTTELHLAHADLDRIASSLGPGFSVRTLVRRGRAPTVMNRFRFDALLSATGRDARAAERRLDWRPEGPSPLETLTACLDDRVESLVLRSVPDARTCHAVRLAEEIDAAAEHETLGRIRRRVVRTESVHPEDAWALGEARGYGVAVSPSASIGHVDMAFALGRDEWAAASLR